MRLKHHDVVKQTPYMLASVITTPSGKDMSRDIVARLEMFMGGVHSSVWR